MPVYDGEGLAKKGVIVVTVNYRLGIFGFFTHPELTAESDVPASGNYALLDLIAVLHWVHNNIAAFGGNPNRVTIGGQSAGASDTHSRWRRRWREGCSKARSLRGGRAWVGSV